ncbi:hypothetical protein AAG906_025317 [Vitis piasezkii]
MGFLSLFVVALVPILKVLLVTGVGLLIALERIDLLGANARRNLNAIVFYVFNPALVSSNLAKTITFSSLVTMWFMPVNILLTFVIGSALGWVLIKITRTPQHLQGLVLGCCSAGNLGNLLLIIIPAICEEEDNPFGDSDCSTNGEAYASLSLAIGAIGIWSYVYTIMRISANKCKREINLDDSTISIRTSGETLEILSEGCTEALLPSKDCPSSRECSDEVELTHAGSEGKQKVPFLEKIKQQVEILMEKIDLKKVFAPSTIGVIVGFFIGLISPIRKLIIGDSAPLHVIESSAYFVGEAAVPSTTLIMGANLLKGLKGSDVSIVVILGIMAVRYIALPLLGVVVVKAAHHFGLVGSNSLFQFVLMLQYALPPAMSTGTMSQLFEFGQSECSVIMLWTYAVLDIFRGMGYYLISAVEDGVGDGKAVGVGSGRRRGGARTRDQTLLCPCDRAVDLFVPNFFNLPWRRSGCFDWSLESGLMRRSGIILRMGLLDLFFVASMPVIRVLLLTALGSFLALDRIDILGDVVRKQLNTVVFFVFNPALVYSNLANTITLDRMVLLWFMPLNILTVCIIGSALGLLLVKTTRAPQHLKGLILGSCAAGNMGNMPLIIIPAVCREKGSPFGAPDVCHTFAMAYASLSMAIGAICLWSYVYNIVRVFSSNAREGINLHNSPINMNRESLLASGDCSISEEYSHQFTLPHPLSEENLQVAISGKMKQLLRKFSRKINLKELLAPSTTGAIVGFIIGMVPHLRKLIIGGTAPLHVVQDSASLLGDAAIPSIILIMGGNLLKGLKGSGIQLSFIVGILAVRFIFLPLLGIIIVKGALRFGLVHPDPLFQFVLLLQYAVPPAINLGTIIQLFGAGESECSVIMLWTYGLASVSLTLWSTLFMWLVS